MSINQVKKPVDTSHENFMGGRSWDINDPILRLRVAASSCFFGEPQYYHDEPDAPKKRPGFTSSSRPASRATGSALTHLRQTLGAILPESWVTETPTVLMEKAIDSALNRDPERTLQEAVRLRNEENIRTTPQVILVRACHHPKVKGTGLVRRYAPRILRRADEPAVAVAYHLSRYGKDTPLPMSLRKACKDFLEGATEYQLGKYRMENRMVKTVDVVNLVRPRATSGSPIDKLVRGELSNAGKTWEAILSEKGSTTEAWTEALDVMGHMALLRNIRNLLAREVPLDLFLDKLQNGVEGGKQLPFRYYSAYKAVREAGTAKPQVLDAIENCLTKSLANCPRLKGKTMSLSDNSGSAHGTFTSSMGSVQVATIGNLTGVIAAMISDEGYVGAFGDKLITTPIRKNSSVFDQLDKVETAGRQVGGATENGIWIFFRDAIQKKEHWDNIFVFSDMQAGHGGLYGITPGEYRDYWWGSHGPHIDVAKLIRDYRQQVNPDVKIYLVQTAGYQDTLVPEYYNKTYILGGWSDSILKFAASMDKLDQLAQ